ncbi:peptidyl-prolyl cis-trans isomerase SurA [Catalinimonas alkaloidigena]|uniref:peptidylprolyl isomerase n=1 Tax=Catalinimonas alkaloidigena TaxID=1075417 RepID=UPI0024064D0B|nr:peptidylprolyl isomerase [Catalinimonas alkaloidigena]MDF9797403.1 peptidyl-prolyl cis-trans isomerase SurA [Catalinimonas alkaloidigena]
MRPIKTTKFLSARLIFFSFVIFFLHACASKKKVTEIHAPTPLNLSEQAIFTYGQDSVIADDFQYIYLKNHKDSLDKWDEEEIEKSVQDYLDLYINFKLKVKAAYAAGFHQQPAFQQEFEKYRKQLAKPFMVENRFKEMLVKEAYDRLKEEIHASHILINVPEKTSGADTIAYFQKADSLRKLALEGRSFSMLAEKYSDDPSAEQNGGNLGYFSGLQMVYPFESVAYQTPPGSISKPVRTNFGYHVIKVHDRRPYQGKVKVAHIMIRFQNDEGENEGSKSYQKALEIYNKLQAGADWNEMTERYSEDQSTRSSGGEFPYFSAGGTLNSFEETAFRLSQVGDISKPVKTRYGWHIIKLVDRKGLEPFEMLRPLIERKIESNLQQMKVEDKTVALLKEENQYEPNNAIIRQSIDYLSATPEIAKPHRLGVLFSISDTVFAFSALEGYLEEKQITLPVDSSRAKQLYAAFEEDKILSYEESHLADKYPDYRRLAQEYKEGILLFDIMEDKVWGEASENESKLLEYYQHHQENYRWKERLDATIFEAIDEKTIQRADQIIGTQKINKRLIEEVEEKVNQESALNLQIFKDIYEEGESRSGAEEVIDQINWKVGSYVTEANDRVYKVVVHEVIPPSQKEFEEVKGRVISDLQQALDREWIVTLRSTYPVSVDKEVLTKLIQQLIAENE